MKIIKNISISFFKIFFLISTCILSIPVSVFAQEAITITTYYPSPVGIYQTLTTQTLGVGDTNADGSINGDDSPDPSIATQQGDLWVAGRIGVGTTSPLTNLEVNNTLRLTPATTPLYTEEGAMYYNDNENVFKYYDGSVWKKMGGVAWGTVQTEVATPFRKTSGGTNTINCPEGWVVKEMKLYTDNDCTISCDSGPDIHRVAIICQQLQQ